MANSRITTKNGRKITTTDMLRKKRKWNHIKCSIKSAKGRKSEKQKQEQRTRVTGRKS